MHDGLPIMSSQSRWRMLSDRSSMRVTDMPAFEHGDKHSTCWSTHTTDLNLIFFVCYNDLRSQCRRLSYRLLHVQRILHGRLLPGRSQLRHDILPASRQYRSRHQHKRHHRSCFTNVYRGWSAGYLQQWMVRVRLERWRRMLSFRLHMWSQLHCNYQWAKQYWQRGTQYRYSQPDHGLGVPIIESFSRACDGHFVA